MVPRRVPGRSQEIMGDPRGLPGHAGGTVWTPEGTPWEPVAIRSDPNRTVETPTGRERCTRKLDGRDPNRAKDGRDPNRLKEKQKGIREGIFGRVEFDLGLFSAGKTTSWAMVGICSVLL